MISNFVGYACSLVIIYQGTLYTSVDAASDFAQPKGSYVLENKQITGMRYQAKISCGDMCGVRILKTKNGSDMIGVVAQKTFQLKLTSFTIQGSDDDATFSFECLRK